MVFDHAYHGRTNLTMALTAKNQPYKNGFGPFAPEVYASRCPTPSATAACPAPRPRSARSPRSRSRSAPRTPRPCSSSRSRARAASSSRTGVPVGACPSGRPRTASSSSPTRSRPGSPAPRAMFASEHEGIVPDLVTTAKGMAGGMPLSAVTGRADIMDSAHVGGLGGTYGGNPSPAPPHSPRSTPSSEHDGLVERAAAIGDLLLGRLRSAQAEDPASATSGAAAPWSRSSSSTRRPVNPMPRSPVVWSSTRTSTV